MGLCGFVNVFSIHLRDSRTLMVSWSGSKIRLSLLTVLPLAVEECEGSPSVSSALVTDNVLQNCKNCVQH